MPDSTSAVRAHERTATSPREDVELEGPGAEGPVTLISTFRVREGVSLDQFITLWREIGDLMARRAGFVSVHLYRVNVGSEPRSYIHVAHWTSATLLDEARSVPEIRAVESRVQELLADRRRVLCEAATDLISPAD